MPAAFDACVKAGGRVRTLSGPSKKFGLDKGQFIRVCFRKDGSMVRGYKASRGARGTRTEGEKK